MRAFEDLKISVRLWLAFAVLIALSVFVGMLGINRLKAQHEELVYINEDRMPKLVWLNQIAGNVHLACLLYTSRCV